MGPERNATGERRRVSLSNRLAQFDFTRLSYLQAAIATGSIRGAAETLNTSPSALSRQIAKMEDELQILLVERHGRGVRATEAGSLLVTYFEAQKTQLEQAVDDILDLGELRRGMVSIAMGEGFVDDLLERPLWTFVGQHPELRIDLRLGSTDDIVRRVVDDDAHIGLVFNPPHDRKVQTHLSKRHPTCAVVRPGHLLCGVGRGLLVSDLQGCELGLLPGNYGLRQVLLSAEDQGRIKLSARITANSSRLLQSFAEERGGVIVTPRFTVAKAIKDGSLVALDFDDAVLQGTEAHLITRRGRRLPAAASQMLRYLMASLALLRA